MAPQGLPQHTDAFTRTLKSRNLARPSSHTAKMRPTASYRYGVYQRRKLEWSKRSHFAPLWGGAATRLRLCIGPV